MIHHFIGLWRSSVARTAGGREVAGQKPASPTILTVRIVNLADGSLRRGEVGSANLPAPTIFIAH